MQPENSSWVRLREARCRQITTPHPREVALSARAAAWGAGWDRTCCTKSGLESGAEAPTSNRFFGKRPTLATPALSRWRFAQYLGADDTAAARWTGGMSRAHTTGGQSPQKLVQYSSLQL